MPTYMPGLVLGSSGTMCPTIAFITKTEILSDVHDNVELLFNWIDTRQKFLIWRERERAQDHECNSEVRLATPLCNVSSDEFRKKIVQVRNSNKNVEFEFRNKDEFSYQIRIWLSNSNLEVQNLPEGSNLNPKNFKIV